MEFCSVSLFALYTWLTRTDHLILLIYLNELKSFQVFGNTVCDTLLMPITRKTKSHYMTVIEQVLDTAIFLTEIYPECISIFL